MTDVLGRLRAALAGRYTLERELGRGGMATVWLARDLKHERLVALKVLRPELGAILGPERFLREIHLTARLTHPHILPLHDSGVADGFLFYVMPYAEGESLRDRLNREKQLPLDDALQIAREVADALSYAHSHDVMHRDVKPENILLEAGHAVVADFGIARAITAAGGEKLTETGIAVGTPAYMSPEQGAGSRELDGRSDLYSLGCVLYEMLAGRPPFVGPVESVVHQHLAAEPPSITSLRPAVPAGVAAALSRALAKTPADRFNPVALFGEALGLRGSAAATVPSVVPAVPVSSRWTWRLLLLGAAVVVVVIGAVVLSHAMLTDRRPSHPRTAIAVLPFQNLSADGPHGYFAGGLHDELLTQLAKVAALSVRGRTSVMGYAGTIKPIGQIASELNVGAIVEASVQVVGVRLRVNVQLIDAATDEHLWAERYDRTIDDAFAVQSDVAQRIVAAVGATLDTTERSAIATVPSANAEAYRLYLQGLEYFSRPGYLRRNWEIAQRFYERALALDSTFALAHTALSEVHGWMYLHGYDRAPGRTLRQRQSAEAAVRFGPDLPQAHVAMGLAHYVGRSDWAAALEEYRIALDGLPNDARLWARIGWAYRRLGNWDDALAAADRVRELDPRDLDNLFDLSAATLRVLRRYGDAVARYDQALAVAPDLAAADVQRARTWVLWRGRLDTLKAVLERLPEDADLGSLGPIAAWQALTLYWDRKPDSLLSLLAATRHKVLSAQAFYWPTALYAAWAHRLRGDDSSARAAFDTALALLDSVVAALPDDWRVHAARGLALAGLGRRREALREARWLEQSAYYRYDRFQGTIAAEQRAHILAEVGETDAAFEEIERLLAGPATFSVWTLRLDPLWDPIRDDPRFQALLVKYANPRPVR